MICGVVGYVANAVVIYRYVRGLQKQIQAEVREEKRRKRKHGGEGQDDDKWAAHGKVIKENTGYRWTMHIGTFMFLLFVVGLVWMILRMIHLLP